MTQSQASRGPQDAPIEELSEADLFRELEHLYAARLETLRHGSDASVAHHDRRTADLEAEYRRRFPTREVDERRLRPVTSASPDL